MPLIDLGETVELLSSLDLTGKLIVEMNVLISHPKEVLLRAFGDRLDVDLVTAHPMFGAIVHAKNNPKGQGIPFADESWDGRPVIYEKVRVSDVPRFERFLKVFEEARCQVIEMSSEQHDATVADAEFVTYLTGRLLTDKQLLPPSPVISKEYAALSDVADLMAGDSFDMFFGMFKYNDRAKEYMSKLRENLARVERQLAAKDAYLTATVEMKNNDRQKLLAETRILLQEVLAESGRKPKQIETENKSNVDHSSPSAPLENADLPTTATKITGHSNDNSKKQKK